MEMDLTKQDERELRTIAGHSRGGCPPENPDVKPITEELLIAPHPGEPGVDGDGRAAPLENPGH